MKVLEQFIQPPGEGASFLGQGEFRDLVKALQSFYLSYRIINLSFENKTFKNTHDFSFRELKKHVLVLVPSS